MTDETATNYKTFIQRKTQLYGNFGFSPTFIPDYLFPFQRDLVTWATQKGRAAVFADCGMGKTIIQLSWAENIFRKTKKPVLILTPLAVAQQTEREAEKFGIEAQKKNGTDGICPITITNYEKLHKFDPKSFSGVVCDESSILKSFDGSRRSEITRFMRKIKYRLLSTATAAPNDYIELGTSSEALGYMGHVDMLGKFFVNDHNNVGLKRHYGEAPKWRFKGHASEPFWKWVSSWAKAIRMPSDMGYENDDFVLPKLIEREHIIENVDPCEGFLFNLPACNLPEQREEMKRTVSERSKFAAEIAGSSDEPFLIMCNRNDEGDLLEKNIKGAVQISGKDSDEQKESKFLQFLDGSTRVLVTKPKIGAWGLNFQHCARVIYFPTHSYEQYYQSVRRCWRFGQKRNVEVDLIMTEGLKRVMSNLRRKSKQADEMFRALVKYMNKAQEQKTINQPNEREDFPVWLYQNKL